MSNTPRVRTAAIVAIGDELTTGQSLDTNSRWLASFLLERGVTPVEHVTLPDDTPTITAAFRRLADAAEVIVTTGGLGPTADDLTRDALSAAMLEPLVIDDNALAQITARFNTLGRSVSDAQRVQALRPTTARCLPNSNGTAPGLVGVLENSQGTPVTIWCMPGPPRELRPIVERELGPWLTQHAASRVTLVKLHACGLGESDAAAKLGDILDRNNEPVVGITASKGIITLRIRRTIDAGDAARTSSPLATDEPLERTIAACRERLGDYIFGQGESTLPTALLQLLRERGQKLVVVESCTGGLLGAMLTDPPGASDIFLGGWITYANEMKRLEVGVPTDVLASRGAVNRQVAQAMADGALAKAPDADYALSITGVAGPGGGSVEKPVGTVWIALASRPSPEMHTQATDDIRCFRITGDRSDIRERSALTAMNLLRLTLQTGAPPSPLLWQIEPPPTTL